MHAHRLPPDVADAISRSPFSALGLSEALVRAVLDEKYETPSPVQFAVIPPALQGHDVLACAQTGTGKTAGFVLPMLAHLSEKPGNKIRGLVLTPTRELAAQIDERIEAYGKYVRVRHAVIYGGVSQHKNEVALRRMPDLLVATPGRLLDLIHQRIVDLSGITHFVLDEADRMLDMGFIHDVKKVVARLPVARQTLFFSATMAPAVETLARGMLRTPVTRVDIKPEITTAEGVEQAVIFVEKTEKRYALESLLKDEKVTRALVFTRTKHGADRLVKQLDAGGFPAVAIHGNKAQNARERALLGFRTGQTRILVATDLAARGIDVDDISLVVNFDLPNVPESYVHRIGRTGRAGAIGRAVSFCDREERPLLADIEKLIKKRLPVIGDAPRPAQPHAQPHAPRAQAPHAHQGHRGHAPNASRSHAPRAHQGGSQHRAPQNGASQNGAPQNGAPQGGNTAGAETAATPRPAEDARRRPRHFGPRGRR